MPPKSQQKRRPLEDTTEPLAGKIVFVPPKNRITARLKPDLERTGYNHPGVIISSRPDGVGRVKIAMVVEDPRSSGHKSNNISLTISIVDVF